MDDRGLAGRDGRGRRPPLARANGRIDDDRRARPEQRQGLLNGEVSPFEIGAYHHVEALLCHLFERQELAVTCIYEQAVQVPELPLDRGEHRIEVGEFADVLEGRLTVSAPWQLSSANYRVKPGRTETISIRFEPDEGRQFVGQITLAGVDGTATTVQLVGEAGAPVRAEPDHLNIPASNEQKGPRVESVALTNQTERYLTLKLEAGSNIQPIPEIALGPHERKEVSLVVLPEWSAPWQEDIALVGAGFKVRLHVDAGAPSIAPMISSTNAVSPKISSTVLPRGTSPDRRETIERHRIRSRPVWKNRIRLQHRQDRIQRRFALKANRLEASAGNCVGHNQKQRSRDIGSRNALFRSMMRVGCKRVGAKLLQVNATALGKEVVAQIKGLEPNQRHMVRVTAIGGSGTALWESPVVALNPPAGSLRSERPWLVLLGIALLAFLFLRWRSDRSVA